MSKKAGVPAPYTFISGFGYAAWAARIPAIRQEYALSDAMLGTLLFAMPVALYPAGRICF